MQAITYEKTASVKRRSRRAYGIASPQDVCPDLLKDDVVLEFRNISKVYGTPGNDHAVVAVQNINLSVKRGEVLCLMGTSGSGKSTLLRHANRLIEPSSGEILINGESLGSLTTKELREMRSRCVGMVFQHFGLLPHRSVRENVGLPLEMRGESDATRSAEVDRQLRAVGLSAWGDHYPSQLSGGMQQRVGLARALVSEPQILLLDEPFSALDPSIRRDLQAHFLRIVRERQITAILVTHDPGEALRLADRIAIIRAGQLVQVGTPDELLSNPVDAGVADFFRDDAMEDSLKVEFTEPITVQAAGPAASEATPARYWRLTSLLLGPAALAARGREGLFWLGMVCEMIALAGFCIGLRAPGWGAEAGAATVWIAIQLLCAVCSSRHAAQPRAVWLPAYLLLFITQGFVAWRALSRDTGVLAHFPENHDAMLAFAGFIDRSIVWSQTTFESAFVGVIFVVRSVIDGIEGALAWLPWPVPVLCLIFVAWRISSVALALASACALLYLGMFGFWTRTIATLALVGSSVVLSLLIGIPTGILLARHATARRVISPLLDVMQTLPTFVYLIPAVAFFSVGKTPAVIATVIFALPPMIRLTALGIQEVPKSSVEAAIAHGATVWQTLTKVELPLASGSLLLGVNQTIVMSMSMVVVAALIGADGLGYDVMTALRNVRGGEGMLAGFAIVFCALIPDRLIRSALKRRHKLFNSR